MIAAWPESLPNFESGASEGFAGTNVEGQGAVPIGRNRVRGKTKPFDGAILINEAQLDTFNTFFTDTLSGGIFQFSRPHPRTGVTGVFRFKKPNPIITGRGGDIYSVAFKLVQIR